MKLWVDDLRPRPDTESRDWVRMVSSGGAIAQLDIWKSWGVPLDEVSLDHDLGFEDTGMRVLEWIIETGYWPRVLTIHTANPPARENMLRAANAEAPDWVDIFVKHW